MKKYSIQIIIIIILIYSNCTNQFDNQTSVITTIDAEINIKERFVIGEDSLDFKYEPFTKITDLTCDLEGNLYVADRMAEKIHIFNNQGKFVKSFGRKGQGPGEFAGSLNLGFNSEDTLFVYDTILSRMSIFDSSGRFLKSFNMQNPNSTKIHFLKDGSLVLQDFGSDFYFRIYNIDFDREKGIIEKTINQELTIDRYCLLEDKIYITTNNKIAIYSKEGLLQKNMTINVSKINRDAETVRKANLKISKMTGFEFTKKQPIGSLTADPYSKSIILLTTRCANFDINDSHKPCKVYSSLYRIFPDEEKIEKISIGSKVIQKLATGKECLYILSDSKIYCYYLGDVEIRRVAEAGETI